MKYTFFVQPQVNKRDDTLFGYECLLRKNNNGIWQLPQSFTEISINDQINILQKIADLFREKSLDNLMLSFNLNREQANDPSVLDKIIMLKKDIQPFSLTVELTEAIPLAKIKTFSEILHQYNVELAIDDVGTGSNVFENIHLALPYVDKIKCAMQNLRMSGQAKLIPEYLKFWSDIAQNYHLGMILEGIEDNTDLKLAEQFGIDLLQGYFYGKPALVH